MSKKINTMEKIKELITAWALNDDKENDYLMRFHRCYLDGSYGDISNTYDGGYKLYQLHVRKYSKKIKDETLKKESISTFKQFLNIEFFNRRMSLNNRDIEIMLKETLTVDQFEEFVNMLKGNIIDLVS